MHCPKCGYAIESDEVGFCSRCGQELSAVRYAFKGSEEENEIEVRHSGINFGVVLMALVVAIAATVLVADQIRNPLAFSLVIAMMGYLGILLASGPLVRAFGDAGSPARERARRREMAFGATAMFVGSALVTAFAASLPARFGEFSLLPMLFIQCMVLMFSSRFLYDSFRGLTGPSRAKQIKSGRYHVEALPQAAPETALLELAMAAGFRRNTADLEPRSVTENTTRHLDSDAIDR
jgi:hypothetical protein